MTSGCFYLLCLTHGVALLSGVLLVSYAAGRG